MEPANSFLVLPPEVWVKIVKKLPTHYDVERLCIAFAELKEYIETYLLEWKQREALKCILGNDMVAPADVVAIRQTCKNWRNVFDEYCSKPYSVQKQPLWAIPYVRITLPLEEAGVFRLRQLADYNQNPFVGGRLGIELIRQMTEEEIRIMRQLFEETKRLGRHVKHLVISVEVGVIFEIPFSAYRGPDGFCQAVVYPWTIEMSQVVSITFDVPSLGADVTDVLPNPELVESVYVTNSLVPWSVDETEDWQRLLQQCCTNVKWFYVQYMGFDLEGVLDCMNFANVEGFIVEKYAGCHEDTCQFPLELITPHRFPKLQELGIPFENGLCYWNEAGEDEEEDDEENSRESNEALIEEAEDDLPVDYLVESKETSSEDDGSEAEEDDQGKNNALVLKKVVRLTHRMCSLQTIYLYGGEYIVNTGFPISVCTNSGASATVTKLEFPNVCMKGSWSWIKAVSSYFPALRSITLEDSKMSRSKGCHWEFVGRVDSVLRMLTNEIL